MPFVAHETVKQSNEIALWSSSFHSGEFRDLTVNKRETFSIVGFALALKRTEEVEVEFARFVTPERTRTLVLATRCPPVALTLERLHRYSSACSAA
jgi:hypothetical protein